MGQYALQLPLKYVPYSTASSGNGNIYDATGRCIACMTNNVNGKRIIDALNALNTKAEKK